ncbi:hypothetical protein C2I18_11475 [Paenibacillus sp. PK3_47]|uniref:MerR family transcriptional regulator n=1 Tax=Paenibacillus sp. PK3_47 TaxID=2072642 RepID=UPI00201DD03A|nr:MerR family transcriptional regulator [Paenibacillus sp. PK3_47]UQZ34093.1 hypothetical protein C2I18_11475 [Paenibacillus sp. PK3_47]
MDILKTKEAADLLSVSQTTIKRWAAIFPEFFPKDRFGHYTFSERQVGLLIHIKDRIDNGEQLDSINLQLAPQEEETAPEQSHPSAAMQAEPIQEMHSRMDYIERLLEHKADEVVSVQLLQQRKELEDMRQMIQQLAVSLEHIQKPAGKPLQAEGLHPAAAAKLQTPPKKRSLLRSLFSLL